jgi:hypothetical protein
MTGLDTGHPVCLTGKGSLACRKQAGGKVAAHGREDGNGANEVDPGNLPKGLVQRYVEVTTHHTAPAPAVWSAF